MTASPRSEVDREAHSSLSAPFVLSSVLITGSRLGGGDGS